MPTSSFLRDYYITPENINQLIEAQKHPIYIDHQGRWFLDKEGRVPHPAMNPELKREFRDVPRNEVAVYFRSGVPVCDSTRIIPCLDRGVQGTTYFYPDIVNGTSFDNPNWKDYLDENGNFKKCSNYRDPSTYSISESDSSQQPIRFDKEV